MATDKIEAGIRAWAMPVMMAVVSFFLSSLFGEIQEMNKALAELSQDVREYRTRIDVLEGEVERLRDLGPVASPTHGHGHGHGAVRAAAARVLAAAYSPHAPQPTPAGENGGSRAARNTATPQPAASHQAQALPKPPKLNTMPLLVAVVVLCLSLLLTFRLRLVAMFLARWLSLLS